MTNGNADAIARLERLIPEFEAELRTLRQEAEADGEVTADERELIDDITQQIEEARARYAQLCEEDAPMSMEATSEDAEDEMTPAPSPVQIELLIRTEILSFDPQAGMKSEQTLLVDFGANTVTSSYRTGTTSVLGVSIGSVRDNFVVSAIRFTPPAPGAPREVTFSVEGETASGVLVMPNINYAMDFRLRDDGSLIVSGAHDGYPAYFVYREGDLAYSYHHKAMEVFRLAGTSDVRFAGRSLPAM